MYSLFFCGTVADVFVLPQHSKCSIADVGKAAQSFLMLVIASFVAIAVMVMAISMLVSACKTNQMNSIGKIGSQWGQLISLH